MTRRRNFTFLSLLSLLLCLATVVLWVRSYWHCDLITGARWGRYISAASYDRRVYVTLGRGYSDEPLRWWPEFISRQTLLEPAWGTRQVWGALPDGHYFLGFSFEWGAAALYTPKRRLWSTPPPPEPVIFVTTHFLWPTAITAALPLWLLSTIIKRKKAPGACATCSYDLTGNVSGVCPECGTAVATRGGT